MRVLAVLAALLLVSLSGCFAEGGDDDEGGAAGPETGAATNNTTLAPEVFRDTGMVTASTSVVGFSDGGMAFTVADGATLLFAELQWDDPVADLDATLASPSSGSTDEVTAWDHVAAGGMPGSPDSPHSLTVERPETGDWIGGAQANGAAANVEYNIVVTIFFGETSVPEGYTALA